MSAAPVAGDMAGLSRMPLDLPADAPTPLYRLSATGQHSQGETPYATEDASLPGLVDNTTPGLEHDLSHASGSTTPLMTLLAESAIASTCCSTRPLNPAPGPASPIGVKGVSDVTGLRVRGIGVKSAALYH